MKKGLAYLAKDWNKLADEHRRRANDNWKKLETGELPQVDAIIYSVYEDQARANTLEKCASELMANLLAKAEAE